MRNVPAGIFTNFIPMLVVTTSICPVADSGLEDDATFFAGARFDLTFALSSPQTTRQVKLTDAIIERLTTKAVRMEVLSGRAKLRICEYVD
jgi:hypothetical protein